MKSRCITAAGLLHFKFILCHANELHFHTGIRRQFFYPGHLFEEYTGINPAFIITILSTRRAVRLLQSMNGCIRAMLQ